jgi:hypothetical protein
MRRNRKMALTYLALAYILISAIAATAFIAKRPTNSAPSNGQQAAQSFSDDINRLKEYRRSLSIANSVLLLLAAISATLIVVASRLSDEAADEQSEWQSRLDDLKEKKFTDDLKDKDVKIAEANKSAEQARLDLARFRAPRFLNSDQQKRIVEKLNAAGLNKNQSVFVTAAPGTAEARVLAGQILSLARTAFVPAGADWFPGGETIGPMTGYSAVSEVVVFCTRDPRSQKTAEVLTEGLIAEGIKAQSIGSMPGCEKAATNPDDPYCFHIFVVVGPKQ